MKNARHSKILELIGQHSIDKQEELLAHLRRSGFEVTQATVSRDIRELGLVKVATGDGHYRYVAASGAGKSAHSPSRFETIFRESVLKADFAGHFVLVKCYTGMANAAAFALDTMKISEIVGTIAGDDNVLIILRDNESAENFFEQTKEMLR